MHNDGFLYRKALLRNWYWLPLAVLILLPLVYCFTRLNEQAFWDAAIGNWLATMLGVIVGVPVALSIERRRASRRQEQLASEFRRRSRNVLLLTKDELQHNLRALTNRKTVPSSFLTQRLKDDLWQALSDSGEIKWIDDPALLSGIATAYHFVAIVRDIEEKAYAALRGINPRYDDGSYASERLLQDARAFDNALLASLATALVQIEDELGSAETPENAQLRSVTSPSDP